VSDTATTVITVTDAAAGAATDRAAARRTDADRQPGSAIGENGKPCWQDVQIGISTVPPELVRDMLPPGVLQHTFDITIQAPGRGGLHRAGADQFPERVQCGAGHQAEHS
jgi:hypothetical protein